MGTFKNQKDKVVGSAKEKLGEILNKDELVDEGRAQSEAAKENDERYKARVDELEDQQAEKEAKEQDHGNAALVREVHDRIDVEQIKIEHGKVYNHVRQHLSEERHKNVVVCHLHEFLRCLHLQFLTQSISRYEEHEQQQTARYEHCAEVGVIVDPRV